MILETDLNCLTLFVHGWGDKCGIQRTPDDSKVRSKNETQSISPGVLMCGRYVFQGGGAIFRVLGVLEQLHALPVGGVMVM